MKRLMLVLSAIAMFGFVFGGCKKDKPAEPAAPPADEAKHDPAPPPPPAEPQEEGKPDEAKEGDPAEPAPEGEGFSVGVPECDDYINKYTGCLKDKIPEASRGAMEQGLNTMKEAWKKAAETEAGKAGLANACKMALDAAKKSMGAFGCEW